MVAWGPRIVFHSFNVYRQFTYFHTRYHRGMDLVPTLHYVILVTSLCFLLLFFLLLLSTSSSFEGNLREILLRPGLSLCRTLQNYYETVTDIFKSLSHKKSYSKTQYSYFVYRSFTLKRVRPIIHTQKESIR